MEVGITSVDPDLDAAILVALGSNLSGGYAAPEALLEEALCRFPEVGLPIRARSRWWRSAAWPDPSEPAFVNGVVWVETKLGPRAVFARLQQLEAAFGRTRDAPNSPRTLDLDLIAHGRSVMSGATLQLPHPRAYERGFVMGPLAEITPEWRHPVSGRTAGQLARDVVVAVDAAPLRS